jgi:hypothetical protein
MAVHVKKLNEISPEPEEHGESVVLFAAIVALLVLALVNGV